MNLIYVDNYVKVRRSNHDIIVSELKISPDEIEAGDFIVVTAEIANIGERNEDNAEVTIKNSELGINVVSDDYDLKSGKTKKFTFDITIPRTATDKTYNLEAVVSYDDDSSDEDDTPLSKTIDLVVTGGTSITLSDSLVSVFGDILGDGGTATLTATKTTLSADRGKAVKYDLLLTNTDTNTKLYELKVTGVSDWATYLIEAGGETNKVSIPAGMSLPVYVYVTPKTDAASGTHTASVAVYSGGQLAGSEILTANVAGGFTTGLFTGAGVMFSPIYDWLTWIVIGLVALVAVGVVVITLYLKQKD